MGFNPRPWEVPLEQYKALEAELDSGMSKEERDQLVKLSIHITQRLGSHKRYGHVVAYLYRTWAHAQGRDATLAWWHEYDEQLARAQEEAAEPAQQGDFNF
jgi:hypothetical protein